MMMEGKRRIFGLDVSPPSADNFEAGPAALRERELRSKF